MFGTEPNVVVQESIQDVSVSVFPNPSQGKFTLKLENQERLNAHLQIVNLIGKVVWEGHADGHYSASIDLSREPKGVYFLQIRVRNQISTRRIILQ